MAATVLDLETARARRLGARKATTAAIQDGLVLGAVTLAVLTGAEWCERRAR